VRANKSRIAASQYHWHFRGLQKTTKLRVKLTLISKDDIDVFKKQQFAELARFSTLIAALVHFEKSILLKSSVAL